MVSGGGEVDTVRKFAFFAKMTKQIKPNVITFCSDFPYKKVYEIIGYFKE